MRHPNYSPTRDLNTLSRAVSHSLSLSRAAVGLGVPCLLGQAYAPPYKTDRDHVCNATEKAYVKQYGSDFMAQFAPVLSSQRNGCFLVSCIQHGIAALITVNGQQLSLTDALTQWRTSGPIGKSFGYHFVDGCGHDGDTPCNLSPTCAPY